MNNRRPIKIALLFFQSDENATLSYQHGWPRAFTESPFFACTSINLARLNFCSRVITEATLRFSRFDAVVLLHSVFSNQQNLYGQLFRTLAACKVPKAYFIGNEYKLMPEKISFCKQLGISLLASQSNDDRVTALYRATLDCNVVGIPNTGVDANIFYPTADLNRRQIDIGYRTYPSLWYLGNNEKTEIAEYFKSRASKYGFSTDISLSREDRFEAHGYAAFLNRCYGQIGTEAGGDYFELTDNTRRRVNAYIDTHPDTTWQEIKKIFFDNYGLSVPIRIISGRQVESAACKTVQILFEGRYNGYFYPDEHYIELAKDYSNFDTVIEKFRDFDFCKKLVENAYDTVMSELTYSCLLKKFAEALKQIL